MINQDKWINSLSVKKNKFDDKANQLDADRWLNTISKNNISTQGNKYNSLKKYSLAAIFFVGGILLVSTVKNETRNLQKEVNNLQASIRIIQFNLSQAILDNEVITSPENISILAKEYLSTDLLPYKRSQIKNFNDKKGNLITVNKIKKEKTNKIKKLPKSVKLQVSKRIEKTKTEIKKLQELYNDPKSIPVEIRTQLAKQIKEKEIELKNIYRSPKDVLTFKRVGRWSVVQIVKAFFGMPIIPGR